jgi:hypothetical protein
MEALGVWIPSPFDFSHATPVNFRWISVLFVARHNAALAADALAHVEVKPILLAGQQSALWDFCRLGTKRCAALRSLGGSRLTLPDQQEVRTWLFRPFE